MKKEYLYRRSLLISLGVVLAIVLANPALAGITPVDTWESEALSDPNPAVFGWVGSIAYYDNQIIYAGNDQKIYAYDLDTENSTELLDLSGDANFSFGPSGFMVSDDNYLYFHDNGNSDKVYRVDLTAAWPASIESFNTGATGSIYAFTQNPWTDAVWFTSADFGAGNMHLYEVNASFDLATQRASFGKPHGENAGNGPIIFKGASTLLYGESVWGGDGYFHLVDSTTGDISTMNYLTFTDGLAAAAYGYDNVIYATTGNGRKIYKINGSAMEGVATTDNDAQGIVFDGISFYVSEMETGLFTGAVSFNALWHLIPTGVPSGQAAAEDAVDGELAVNCQGLAENKAIGISAVDNTTFVEYLESIDPDDIDEQTNRPDSLPFGLVNFRLKVTSQDGTATVTVFLSEAAPVGSKWYKYDWINGWYDYSDHATLTADRKSVILKFKDGGYGDADRIVNRYIVDPGGLATFSSSSEDDGDSTGGGGGCFINTAASGSECNALHISLAIMVLGTLIGACLALRSSGRG